MLGVCRSCALSMVLMRGVGTSYADSADCRYVDTYEQYLAMYVMCCVVTSDNVVTGRMWPAHYTLQVSDADNIWSHPLVFP